MNSLIHVPQYRESADGLKERLTTLEHGLINESELLVDLLGLEQNDSPTLDVTLSSNQPKNSEALPNQQALFNQDPIRFVVESNNGATKLQTLVTHPTTGIRSLATIKVSQNGIELVPRLTELPQDRDSVINTFLQYLTKTNNDLIKAEYYIEKRREFMSDLRANVDDTLLKIASSTSKKPRQQPEFKEISAFLLDNYHQYRPTINATEII